MPSMRLCVAAAIAGTTMFGGCFIARAELDTYVQEVLVRANPEIDETLIRKLEALDICIGRTVSQSTECKVFRGLRNAQWTGFVIALAGIAGIVLLRGRAAADQTER